MPWTIIVNPRAGRGRATKLLPQIRALRPDDEILLTTAPGEAETLAFDAAKRGGDIAAGGGDGTLNEVLNGVMRARAEGADGDKRLAVLPLGTGNDFARTVKLHHLPDAVRALDEGVAKLIDVGVAHGKPGPRYWLNIAGAGFDAAVATRINRGGLLRGTPAYIAAVTHTLRTFRAADIETTCDGEGANHKALLYAIANAQSYGGGMRIAPEASLDDGLLDTCVIRDATPLEFLRAFPSVFKGAHTGHPKITMGRGAAISLRCDGWPVLLDGEVWTEASDGLIEFSVQPRSVRMIQGSIKVAAPG